MEIKHLINNIDNVSKNLNNIDNDNVDRIANKLVIKLNNPSSREFYCKVAWRLPEARVWYNLESAERGKNPQRLFTWLCKQDLVKLES